jgi:gluconolactonase
LFLLYPPFQVHENGSIFNGKIFAKANDYRALHQKLLRKSNLPVVGNADGLKVDDRGNIWATGIGGVLVFHPNGTHLGTIATGVKTGNVELAEDGYLYIAAETKIGRIPVKVKPSVRKTDL